MTAARSDRSADRRREQIVRASSRRLLLGDATALVFHLP
jgi:hypothetical protein